MQTPAGIDSAPPIAESGNLEDPTDKREHSHKSIEKIMLITEISSIVY